jgi:hypothetical protein
VNMLLKAGASFSHGASERYRLEGCSWTEDWFTLSEYAFSDSVVTSVGDIIRANGWKGRRFFGREHTCFYYL